LVGVAVNVTHAPEHICPEGLAEILTDAATAGFTTIVTGADVAVFVVMHVASEVNTQVTASPLAGV